MNITTDLLEGCFALLFINVFMSMQDVEIAVRIGSALVITGLTVYRVLKDIKRRDK